MKQRKKVTVWAVIPNDFELSTQYCDTKEDAENMASRFYRGEASVSEMEQFKDVIDRKSFKTASRGYRL